MNDTPRSIVPIVTLGLTLALTIVGGGIAWGTLGARVDSVAEQTANLKSVPERLARIEERLGAILERMDREERNGGPRR